MDPKVKNLFKFLFQIAFFVVTPIVAFIWYSKITDPLKLLGILTFAVALWRALLHIYRRRVLPAKKPESYGRWAIVTGTTSGIGAEFASYLAKRGMSILLISRSVEKLEAQQKEFKEKYPNVTVEYLAYNYSDVGPAKDEFYKNLTEKCKQMDTDGGIGVLVNNVGTANEIPMALDEFSEKEIADIINCNVFSVANMTRTVYPFMKAKKSGAVVSISSGSGNHPGPFIAVYSATKAFMTQFTRSMHVEAWGTGVDFLVVTPFYVVSNLYKRKKGTIIAPMPIELVKGTFKQLGKKYIWQGHGYWFHGILGVLGTYYWGAADRYRKMMVDNRKRYDERQKKQ